MSGSEAYGLYAGGHAPATLRCTMVRYATWVYATGLVFSLCVTVLRPLSRVLTAVSRASRLHRVLFDAKDDC